MPWSWLERELDLWAAAGATATLWWRDDDAVRDSEALQHLLGLARAHRTPLCLAAIPAEADASLAAALRAEERVIVVQHGWRHANHAGPGEKKAEFTAGRDVTAMEQELAAGLAALRQGFGNRCRAVLVPPWNRLADALVGRLANLGLQALSRYGARNARWAAPGLQQVNAHLDPVDWHGDRGFVGEAAALDRLVSHLRARRHGEADAEEPSGLLTHHLAHDAAGWNFIERLLVVSSRHAAVRWLAFDEALNPDRS